MGRSAVDPRTFLGPAIYFQYISTPHYTTHLEIQERRRSTNLPLVDWTRLCVRYSVSQ